MTLKIKKIKDKEAFENTVAYLKAILIQEAIHQLRTSPQIREKIKKEIIQKMQTGGSGND